MLHVDDYVVVARQARDFGEGGVRAEEEHSIEGLVGGGEKGF